jgi:hydroxymethylpyrimidine pyrophosphatase-like HAD family hydrolase
MRPSLASVTDLRAVVTDLDGTILRPDQTVSAATVAAIAALRAAEVPLIVATARTPAGISVLGPVLAEVSVAVCCNGAIGLARPGSEVLWQHWLDDSVGSGCLSPGNFLPIH